MDRLYKKLNPISLRKAIEKDLGEVEHKQDATCPTAENLDEKNYQTENSKEAGPKKSQDWNGTGENEDDDALYLGLRVYAKNNVVVTIHGRLA